MEIENLYFGIKLFGFNTRKLEDQNLFSSYRILRSIALYIAEYKDNNEDNFIEDPLVFCFGDTRGRVEYEYYISGPTERETYKVDVWDMYIAPNRNHLMKLVNLVSKESAERWVKEDERRRKL